MTATLATVDSTTSRDSRVRKIHEYHRLASEAFKHGLEYARRCGEELIAIKADLLATEGYGTWLPWLTENCPEIAHNTAEGYMRLARKWDLLSGRVADLDGLSQRRALALIANSEAPAYLPGPPTGDGTQYAPMQPCPTCRRNVPRDLNIVFYRGPSLFNGEPILAVAVPDSDNPKTGPVVQLYILRADMRPVEAINTGADTAICGDCPLRGQNGKGRCCYVNVGTAPNNIYNALAKAGEATPDVLAQVLTGQRVRVGAYGDPAAVPLDVWRPLLKGVVGWTGFTHAWRTCDPEYLAFLMASVESREGFEEAQARGFRTYRVRPDKGAPLAANEIACPASAEEGHRTTCAECGLCCGTARDAKSVAIIAHGAHAHRFVGGPVG